MSARSLVAALLINAGLGVLYIWSLFLGPFETELAVDRATLSFVAALALVFFTVGMVLYAAVLRRTSAPLLAAISLGLAGLGHILVGFFPGVPGLIIGYGILFGMGGGFGYLLALAVATRADPRIRGMMVGITVATFAASGVVLAFFIPGLIARDGAVANFTYIGIALWVAGAVSYLLLRGTVLTDETDARDEGSFLGPLFWKLAVAFFAVCAMGLMVIAHSTGILVAYGAGDLASYGPIVCNIGYIVGCLTGGKLAESLGGRGALTLVCIVLLVALVGLALAMPLAVYLIAIALVGASIGAVASLTPMLIAGYYGVARVGSIYGKLNIAYGLGGLLAPWIAGVLYVRTGGYGAAIFMGIAVAAIGLVASLTIGPQRKAA
jgi:OFA family oxalate/formate antiporter-like MFS transporter